MPQESQSTSGPGCGSCPEDQSSSVGAEQKEPARMLVVLPNWVGDLVLATPALRALRTRFGQTKITGLLKQPLAEVLDGGDWLDETIYWPSGGSKPRRRQSFLGLAGELRKRQFDTALLFTNSFRSALLARLGGVRCRVGYDREGRGLLLTDRLLAYKFDGKYVPMSMIRYYNALARYVGCRECPGKTELFVTPEQERVAGDALKAAGISTSRPLVVINPAASFGPAKCWPAQRFAKVADELIRQRKAAVVIPCGPREVEIARQVAGHMAESATVLDSPVMRLGPLKALIRRADLLVTNDTGPRHFANAFDTPVVTIFGPTDPEWTATDTVHERSLQVEVDCGPCMKRQCVQDHRCMTRVTENMVLEQAFSLLDAGQGRSAAESCA